MTIDPSLRVTELAPDIYQFYGKKPGSHVYLIDTRVDKIERPEEAGRASHMLLIFIRDAQTREVVAEDKREIIK